MSCTNPVMMLQVEITDDNKYLDFNRGGVKQATLTTGEYDNMIDVAAEVQSALNTADSGFSASVGSDGKVTISNAASFELLFGTGAKAAEDCAEILGYAAADTGSSTSHISDYQAQYVWIPEKPPMNDSQRTRPKPLGGDTFYAISGKGTRTTWGTHNERLIEFRNIPTYKTFYLDADTNESFEAFWELAIAGTPFEYYTDEDNLSTSSIGVWVMKASQDDSFLNFIERHSPGAGFYSFSWEMVLQP